MSNLLKLNSGDFIRGLVVAVLVVLLGALQQALGDNGLNFALYDWGAILNAAGTAAVAYLSKNLLTDSNGKVLGRIG